VSERDREPVFLKVEEEGKPEPETASAGGVRPPGRIGSGLDDDHGEREDWRSKPIEDLNLSMRAYTRLRGSGLITVGQILDRTEGQIITRLEGRSGRSLSHVLLRFEVTGRRGGDVPAYQELRERLDELGLVPLDADWDTIRDVN
jgi:Bacterial RNA polymerase, alpha chain C terminal domain